MTNNEKLEKALNLLERAADILSEQPPDKEWFRDYFLLTGDHMILTDKGWQPGENKAPLLAEGYEIDDEINIPA